MSSCNGGLFSSAGRRVLKGFIVGGGGGGGGGGGAGGGGGVGDYTEFFTFSCNNIVACARR